jgi:asparagine synthase (glutamine-hydrolysing)
MTLPTAFSVRIDRESLAIECAGSCFAVGELVVACAGFVSTGGLALTGRQAANEIASAYRAHGSRFTARLLGQYGGIIADATRRSIVLLQDSLGLRTVYFHSDSERLAAASELADAVSLIPNVKVCEEFFARYLRSGQPPAGLTPFAGVRRLSGGVTITLGPGSEVAVTPWRPPETAADSKIAANEAVEILDDLLTSAVLASMPDAGRASCQLSGGMDSSTVALYAKASHRDVEALTFISGSGKAGDDEVHAQAVAEHLDLNWTRIDHDEYRPLSRHDHSPWVMPGGEMFLALRRAYQSFLRERRIEAVLTGSGGDQVFGSTDIIPIHIADDLQRLRFHRAWQEAARWKHTLATTRSESFLVWNYGYKTLWRQWKGESISGWRPPRVPAWLLGEFLSAKGAAGHDAPLSLGLERPGSQYFWELLFRLAESESSTANLGYPAEIRHPLFFRPLAEFMSAIGPGWRRGSGGDRVLHRRLLLGKLPDQIVTRKTKASNQPLCEEALQKSRSWFDILTQGSGLIERRWVDERLWIDTCKKARVGFLEDPEQFNAAMCSEYWLRALDAAGRPCAPSLHAPT